MRYTRCHAPILSVVAAAGGRPRDVAQTGSTRSRGAPGYTSEMSAAPSFGGGRNPKQRIPTISAPIADLPPPPPPPPPAALSDEDYESRHGSHSRSDRFMASQAVFTASEATTGVYRAPSRPLPESAWGPMHYGGNLDSGAAYENASARREYGEFTQSERAERRQRAPPTRYTGTTAMRKPVAVPSEQQEMELTRVDRGTESTRPRRRTARTGIGRTGGTGLGAEFGTEEVDKMIAKSYRRAYERRV
jgi:hypothetical protein